MAASPTREKTRVHYRVLLHDVSRATVSYIGVLSLCSQSWKMNQVKRNQC